MYSKYVQLGIAKKNLYPQTQKKTKLYMSRFVITKVERKVNSLASLIMTLIPKPEREPSKHNGLLLVLLLNEGVRFHKNIGVTQIEGIVCAHDPRGDC